MDVFSLVAQLKQQNKSNEEIINTLQKQGFSYDEIVNAITQYDLQQQSQQTVSYYNPLTDELQAIAETIVSEKISELEYIIQQFFQYNQEFLNKIGEYEEKINKLFNKMERLEKEFKDFENNIANHVESLNSKISAFEGVFERIANSLVESTKELNYLVNKIKEKNEKI